MSAKGDSKERMERTLDMLTDARRVYLRVKCDQIRAHRQVTEAALKFTYAGWAPGEISMGLDLERLIQDAYIAEQTAINATEDCVADCWGLTVRAVRESGDLRGIPLGEPKGLTLDEMLLRRPAKGKKSFVEQQRSAPDEPDAPLPDLADEDHTSDERIVKVLSEQTLTGGISTEILVGSLGLLDDDPEVDYLRHRLTIWERDGKVFRTGSGAATRWMLAPPAAERKAEPRAAAALQDEPRASQKRHLSSVPPPAPEPAPEVKVKTRAKRKPHASGRPEGVPRPVVLHVEDNLRQLSVLEDLPEALEG
jgi:hypothetical protein